MDKGDPNRLEGSRASDRRCDGTVQFVLMLTEKDVMIPDALEVYSRLREDTLRYVAFKDVGADRRQLQDLTDAIHADGRIAILEIADVSERGQQSGFQLAIDLAIDVVVGVWRPEMAEVFGIPDAPEYWPFVGTLSGSPLELSSSAEELATQAAEISAAPEVRGMVLMPYRQQTYDPLALLETVCSISSVPVLVAGGVSQPAQIRSIVHAGAWGFTIGSAILCDRDRDPRSVERRIHEVLDLCQSTGAEPPDRTERGLP